MIFPSITPMTSRFGRLGPGPHKQCGSTLLVALVMLILLTMMAISAMTSTTSSIQVVGNAQFREEANAAGQKAIESVLSSNAFLTTPPAAQQVDVNGDAVMDYGVTFTPAPSCVSFVAAQPTDNNLPAICVSSIGAVCYWTVWDVTAVVTDLHGSGATTTIHQGVKTIAGVNTALASCGV